MVYVCPSSSSFTSSSSLLPSSSCLLPPLLLPSSSSSLLLLPTSSSSLILPLPPVTFFPPLLPLLTPLLPPPPFIHPLLPLTPPLLLPPLLQVCDSLRGLPALLRPIRVPLRRLRRQKLPHRGDGVLHPGRSGLRGRGGPVPGQAGPGGGGLHGHRVRPPEGRPGLRGLHHLRSAGQRERVFPLRRHHLLRGRLRLLLRSDRRGGRDDRVRADEGRALLALRPLRGGVHPPGGAALPERLGGVAGVLLRRKVRLSVAAVVVPSGSVSVGQQAGGGRVLLRQLRAVRGRPGLLSEDTVRLLA